MTPYAEGYFKEGGYFPGTRFIRQPNKPRGYQNGFLLDKPQIFLAGISESGNCSEVVESVLDLISVPEILSLGFFTLKTEKTIPTLAVCWEDED